MIKKESSVDIGEQPYDETFGGFNEPFVEYGVTITGVKL